jgi:hypothetical protein
MALDNVSAGGNVYTLMVHLLSLPNKFCQWRLNYWVDVLFSSGTYAFNLTNVTDEHWLQQFRRSAKHLTVSTTNTCDAITPGPSHRFDWKFSCL